MPATDRHRSERPQRGNVRLQPSFFRLWAKDEGKTSSQVSGF